MNIKLYKIIEINICFTRSNKKLQISIKNYVNCLIYINVCVCIFHLAATRIHHRRSLVFVCGSIIEPPIVFYGGRVQWLWWCGRYVG